MSGIYCPLRECTVLDGCQHPEACVCTKVPPPSDPAALHASTDGQPRGLSIRETVLAEAADLTSGARNQSYNDPLVNMRAQGVLTRTFWGLAGASKRKIGDAEAAALNMVLAKLTRIAVGELKRDNYVDAAAYLAMAFEVAVREAAVPESPAAILNPCGND